MVLEWLLFGVCTMARFFSFSTSAMVDLELETIGLRQTSRRRRMNEWKCSQTSKVQMKEALCRRLGLYVYPMDVPTSHTSQQSRHGKSMGAMCESQTWTDLARFPNAMENWRKASRYSRHLRCPMTGSRFSIGIKRQLRGLDILLSWLALQDWGKVE